MHPDMEFDVQCGIPNKKQILDDAACLNCVGVGDELISENFGKIAAIPRLYTSATMLLPLLGRCDLFVSSCNFLGLRRSNWR